MGKILKATGSIASPMASLGMAVGHQLKTNAKTEIENPSKDPLYSKVNNVVAKILSTEPERNKETNVNKHADINRSAIKGIDIKAEMPHLYQNMQKQQDDYQKD